MRYKFIIIFLLFAICSEAQDSLSSKKNYINTNYIEKYKNIPAVYLSEYNKYNNFSIIDVDSGLKLKYKPNVALSFGPGFGYKWFGIDLSLFSVGKKSDSIYGKTTKFDIQTHFYLKRFLADFVLQSYRGFYNDSLKLKDTTKIILQHTTIRPDINFQSIGGTIMYFTNYKKFSFKSTFSQTEFQKKSAGTWAFGLNFHYVYVWADSCLINQSYKPFFDSTVYYKSFYTRNLGIIGGYFQTFTLHRWFTTLSMLVGFNNKKQLYTLEDNVVMRDTVNLSARLEFRVGLGYNSNRVYFGINFVGDSYIFSKTSQEYGVIRLYLGYRFYSKNKKDEKA